MSTAEEFVSWASAIPQPTGLYSPEHEKDSCGVGFIVSINGNHSYKILADARSLLCNMTHRGAVGADSRDGDGAGVMTSIPHELFVDIFKKQKPAVTLPPKTQYAVGNVYFHPDQAIRTESKRKFETIAKSLGLRVLLWRQVPRDNTILGPSAKQKEPVIEQPFITLEESPSEHFNYEKFEKHLYLLRKQAFHAITLNKWFYICSLSNKTIVYKGLLTPQQVYTYFKDLTNVLYRTHFALVHSRFSTNTFPSWDRAQPMRWCAHNGKLGFLVWTSA